VKGSRRIERVLRLEERFPLLTGLSYSNRMGGEVSNDTPLSGCSFFDEWRYSPYYMRKTPSNQVEFFLWDARGNGFVYK
jgi:hypothetical protein